MNRKLLCVVLVVCLIGLAGCGGDQETGVTESQTESQTVEQTESTTVEHTESELEISDDFSRAGVEKDFYHDISYDIPQNWTKEERGSEGYRYYFPDSGQVNGKSAAFLMVSHTELSSFVDATQDQKQQMLNENWINGKKSAENVTEMGSTENVLYNNIMTARTEYSYLMTDNDSYRMTDVAFVANSGIASFSFAVKEGFPIDYSNDFEAILASLDIIEIDAPETETVDTEVAETEQKSPSYSEGMYKIGTDMPAGEYLITTSSSFAYMQVSSDSSGELESIVTNDNFSNRLYVTVEDGQYLQFDGTAVPASEAPAYEPENGVYGDGVYLVGKDIPAGEYKISVSADSGTGRGYIEVSSDSRGGLESIVSNDNIDSDTYQTVQAGQYLKLKGTRIILN